jgi:Flp pilus assembly protein TadG
MLSKKLFSWVHKVALFAVVFASLAPSISHALAAKQGINSFAQQVCTTDGKKITIAVVTTKGQQLATELTIAETEQAPSPRTIVSHLNHCPFCANPSVDLAIEAPHAVVVQLLTVQAEQIATSTQVVLPRFSVLPPPAQAPPQL